MERFGEGSEERGISRLGREEEVGVEIWGIRRPFRELSRGLAIVDIANVGRSWESILNFRIMKIERMVENFAYFISKRDEWYQVETKLEKRKADVARPGEARNGSAFSDNNTSPRRHNIMFPSSKQFLQVTVGHSKVMFSNIENNG